MKANVILSDLTPRSSSSSSSSSSSAIAAQTVNSLYITMTARGLPALQNFSVYLCDKVALLDLMLSLMDYVWADTTSVAG